MQKEINFANVATFAKRCLHEPSDVYGDICKPHAERRIRSILGHVIYPCTKIRDLNQTVTPNLDFPQDTLLRVRASQHRYDWYYSPSQPGLRGYYYIESGSTSNGQDYHSSRPPGTDFLLQYRDIVARNSFPMAYTGKVLWGWSFQAIEQLVHYCENDLGVFADKFGECREVVTYTWGNPQGKRSQSSGIIPSFAYQQSAIIPSSL
jgi:hypothetical protein